MNKSGTVNLAFASFFRGGCFLFYKFLGGEQMKHLLANILRKEIEVLSETEILKLIEYPKHEHQGDLSFPCFTLSKHLKKSPMIIAQEISERLNDEQIDKVEVVNGYLNVYFNKQTLGTNVIQEVLRDKENFGAQNIGQGKVITMDISSPNIAKPFSMGHLRSTVIGNAVANITEKLGFKPVRINHLGDWGTQFGKLIVAYKKWGNEADVKANPIPELFKLYVKFHDEAEHDEALNEAGRTAFLKLEQGEAEHVRLWTWFREVSLQSFNEIYARLGVSFDSYNGEAFYNDKMDAVVEKLEALNLLVEDQGAEIVKLDDMPPALIKKTNGSTLYITRDLATAIYRKETYDFSESYYFVGNEQSLHFKQLIAVLKMMGYTWSENMEHISFGMILKDGKKMSTRKGKVIFLDEVLDEAVNMAKQNIIAKSNEIEDIDKVAEQIGIGAVIFNDLKYDRQNDIEFDLQDMLKAEGNTCLYLQYTNARIHAIIIKSGLETSYIKVNEIDDVAWDIAKDLMMFEEVIYNAYVKQSPAEIAKYLLQLARHFNSYYANVRILDDVAMMGNRVGLLLAVSIVIEEGLSLLGIETPRAL